MNALEAKSNLIDLFNNYFEVISGDTRECLRKCQELRYQVYCLESKIPGFYPDRYPKGLEYDLYDDRSAHSLLIHRPSGKIAGTVRVILPIPGNSDARFPVEEFASHSFYPDNVSLKNLPRSQLGEISRLIIAPRFRVRKGEAPSIQGVAMNTDYSTEYGGLCNSQSPCKDKGLGESVQRRKFPHTILGLFVAIVRMSAENDLAYWYAGMEPVCARLLQAFGIRFTPISPIVDYYGACRSYLGNISDVLREIYRTNPEIWTLLTNDGVFFPHSRGL
ncbi:MAG: PEP-CTERM/exosortase system-associated acyltransferase [Candidatus Competibacteraceae bacterium]|nr:PEP-CTERM/exosortase system-associated acyltransferase [Candidatus Competibacteraceae bacterium]